MHYWRGFGLLFGLIALFIWFTYYNRGKEQERVLIDQEPTTEARRDFREGKIAFYRFFNSPTMTKGPWENGLYLEKTQSVKIFLIDTPKEID